MQLIGGDTTRGPLTVTVQVQAWVLKDRRCDVREPGRAMSSFSRARWGMPAWPCMPGNKVWNYSLPMPITCSLDLHRPVPRCKEGEALCDVATAMIDVSDGLAADLGHILEASGVGATLNLQEIPLSPSFSAVTAADDYLFDEAARLRLALSAGDDYELCFTVPAAQRYRVEELFSRFPCGCRVIGMIEGTPGLRLMKSDGTSAGY